MKKLSFRFLVLAACAAVSLASWAASPHRVAGSNPGGASQWATDQYPGFDGLDDLPTPVGLASGSRRRNRRRSSWHGPRSLRAKATSRARRRPTMRSSANGPHRLKRLRRSSGWPIFWRRTFRSMTRRTRSMPICWISIRAAAPTRRSLPSSTSWSTCCSIRGARFWECRSRGTASSARATSASCAVRPAPTTCRRRC